MNTGEKVSKWGVMKTPCPRKHNFRLVLGKKLQRQHPCSIRGYEGVMDSKAAPASHLWSSFALTGQPFHPPAKWAPPLPPPCRELRESSSSWAPAWLYRQNFWGARVSNRQTPRIKTSAFQSPFSLISILSGSIQNYMRQFLNSSELFSFLISLVFLIFNSMTKPTWGLSS
jgi:hypothetical protein